MRKLNRGLHFKLVLIMLLLIASLMTVVCAFLVRGVLNYYLYEFYDQMKTVFSDTKFIGDLRSRASLGESDLNDMLAAYAGPLGIDSGTRNYYILSGETGEVLVAGEVLVGSDPEHEIEITPNIIKALNGGVGYEGSIGDDFMDFAAPINSGENSYVIYIKDNKNDVQELNIELFTIIIEALFVGLIISVLLSFLLSKTMIIPIQSLTRAADRVASGDFSGKIEVTARDEIGVLTQTFNDMATRLNDTLHDIENEKNKLNTVFLHMTDGIVAFSKNGEIIHYNPTAENMLGVSFDDPSTGFSEVFSDVVSIKEVFSLRRPDVIRIDMTFGDKSLEISFAPFSSGDAQGGVLAVIHDVTQQKRAEEVRREFVANVSHELKTPITSIISYAETLADSDSSLSDEIRQSFLSVIVNESDRMTNIVKDLLALSKYDAGEVEIKVEPYDMLASIKSVHDAMILDVKKHGRNILLELENSLPLVFGDKDRIEQVLINIISNAVRYTPEGGNITISAGFRSGEVWVKVSDTGIGIPKADLPRLFDRFYRVDKARTRTYGGTGLGLSIANEIVTKHGGRIQVDSEINKGTDVTVWLPVKQGRSLPGSSRKEAPDDINNSRGQFEL